MKKSLLFRIVVIMIAFVGLFSAAQAQVTSSAMTGTIRDAKGVLPGASIRATHTPTGTVYGITTNTDGRYTIGGMRVGGPYTVVISFVGYKATTYNDVYLKLGENFVLNATLTDDAANLSEVKIVGNQPNAVMNSNKSGSSTVIARAQIAALPTITRSVNDLTRLTPQANSTSIGGGNYRSNNFTVDGANFNNQFGIGGNIPANGSPISIDALEQISINVTPYDVRQTGFTGGSVNAVTRSGTNKFFGNAFFTLRGEENQGKRIGDTYRIPDASIQPLDEKQYGFSFGGPIIKDKLFFFVNAEKKVTTGPGTQRLAATPELPYIQANPNVVQAPASFLNEVRSYLKQNYNYETGPYQGYSQVSNNEKLFARLDWNISKNHRFSVRYNQVESQTPASASTSVSGSAVTGNLAYGNVRSGTTRTAGLPFSNSNYYQAANLYSGVAELNSSFGSKFTNVLRATYSHQNDPRTSDSSPFPLVDILDGTQTPTSAGNVLTTFGYEAFTYGNLRDVNTNTFSDDLSIALGKHNITIGAQAEFSKTKNGFQRFGTGFYTFKSWDDFKNNATPLQYSVTYPLTADGSQAYPSFKFAQYSAYLQDEFNITERFKITAGVRLEAASFPDVSEIRTHPLVAAQDFGGRRIDTGELPENRINWSPRFGFNWDVNGDRSLQVRGGSGIFTGRIPFVWIVSQSGDAGLLQYTQTYSGVNTPKFSPSIAPNLTSAAPAAGITMPSTISSLSKDLKFPQTWKSNLAVDFRLPGGVIATLEGIYGRDLNVAVAKNVNLRDPQALNNPASADNRLFFLPTPNARQYVNTTAAGAISATGTTFNNVIQMSNAKGGYNWMATAQLTKQFDNGLGLMVAYTRSDQRNYGDQSGDQLLNLWSIPQTQGNSNDPALSYSSNLNPDRIIANISYRKEYLRNLATSFSLFYEGAQQGRFSYTYSSDFNRDGQTNDLIYIPRNASEITFLPLTVGTGTAAKTYSPAQQNQIFEDYINQDPYLSKHRGEIAKRNGGVSPWRNQFDLRIVQEIFRNIGGTKNSFQFTADIFNVGNLLNRKWGNVNFVNQAAILTPANATAISSTVAPTFRLNTAGGDVVTSTFGTSQTISSTYYMQFGVRYNFQ
ncbi:TonB-dependent receptor [Pedobacter duraquae]|uniref:Carboxypeptidase family protein n=1 Tax=Pedobacter duraquae TaxID=425511 RepID=A0A4R6IKK8_9SPHI|nr:TonB-dependent receptor [Pedobacter duraquae]TDO22624.1 carboxypeptidase family protein [Pedobacter duraquae]